MFEGLPLRRRSFLAGMAGVTTALFLPIEPANAQAFKPFSFAFVSDCHLVTRVPDSFKLTQESQLFLQDAIKQINGLSPDFVLFGGDQVDCVGEDEVNWQLFIDIVQTLNCPWSFILGERDVSGPVPVDKLRTFGRDWKGKGLPAQTSYWSYDVLPGVHLVGLDTSCANSTTGDLSAEQLDWLQKDLDSHKRGLVIVASHHPLLPPAPYDGGPPWDDYTVAQGATAREILNSSAAVRLALSGHVYVSKIEREKDIWYVSSPGLDVFPCAFRFFRVAADGITVETYQIGYPALIKKGRAALSASTLALKYNHAHPAAFLDVAEGTRLDQNAKLAFARNQAAEPIKRRSPPAQEQPTKTEVGKRKHKSKRSKDEEEAEQPRASDSTSQKPDSSVNAKRLNTQSDEPPPMETERAPASEDEPKEGQSQADSASDK